MSTELYSLNGVHDLWIGQQMLNVRILAQTTEINRYGHNKQVMNMFLFDNAGMYSIQRSISAWCSKMRKNDPTPKI